MFGIRQASFLEALGPSVLVARGRASAKGHTNGERSGDIWRMPGLFAALGEQLLWEHTPSHAADHPDFAAIPALLRAAQAD